MKIVELKGVSEIARIYPLIRQLNPDLTEALFKKRLKDMVAIGYRCIAAYEGKKMIAALGFWTGTRFWCGKYIEADNVVVDKNIRSKGIGKKLISWLDQEAKRQKCDTAWLLSYTSNHRSHSFYLREKYLLRGFVFHKELKKSA